MKNILWLLYTLVLIFIGCNTKENPDAEPYFDISPETITFGPTGGVYYITIESNSNWEVEYDPKQWYGFGKTTGRKNGEVKLTVRGNDTYEDRSDIFYFVSGDFRRKFTVKQNQKKSPYLDFEPNDLEFISAGGSIILTIKSNVDWQLVSDDGWCTISTGEGSGDGEVTVSVGSLVDNIERSTQLRLTSTTLTREIPVKQTPDAEQLIVFDDLFFKKYCIENFDQNGDGELSTFEARQVRQMYLYSSNISSLTGIEHFTGLTDLYCGTNGLTTLDLSQNMALVELRCDMNRIAEIKLGSNNSLRRLYCDSNQLEEIDVSGCPNLEKLSCAANYIRHIDVSSNLKLDYLSLSYNPITQLDISGNSYLASIDVAETGLTSLDVSKNTKLAGLVISYNRIQDIDLKNNILLRTFYCQDCDFATIDISRNTALSIFVCTGNKDLRTVYVWPGFTTDNKTIGMPDGARFVVR